MRRLPTLLLGLLFAASMAASQEADEPREGGLTGTGIVALVSTERRLEINGLVFELHDTVAVESKLGEMLAKDLQPGDMVALQLTGDRQDASPVLARHVIQMVGPISAAIDKAYTVLGTKVTNADAFPAKVGDWIAVSGYWREDGIVASRIEVVAPQASVFLQGTYQPISQGSGRIGNTIVRGAVPNTVERGQVVLLSGRMLDETLVIETMDVGLFAPSVQVVLSQGYLSKPDTSGHYTILGAGISSVTTQPEMINQHEFMTACGVDGNLHVDGSEIQDEGLKNSLIALACLER